MRCAGAELIGGECPSQISRVPKGASKESGRKSEKTLEYHSETIWNGKSGTVGKLTIK